MAIFVRAFIEVYLFFTLTACQEVYHTITNIEYPVSFVFAILGLILIVLFFSGLPMYMAIQFARRTIPKVKKHLAKKVRPESPGSSSGTESNNDSVLSKH